MSGEGDGGAGGDCCDEVAEGDDSGGGVDGEGRGGMRRWRSSLLPGR